MWEIIKRPDNRKFKEKIWQDTLYQMPTKGEIKMSQHTTSYDEKLEEGKEYDFEIVNIQGEMEVSGYIKQSFFFGHPSLLKPIEQRLFLNQVGNILKVLGYVEVKNPDTGRKEIQNWDDDEVVGQKIKATFTLRSYMDKKTGQDRKAVDLINFREA